MLPVKVVNNEMVPLFHKCCLVYFYKRCFQIWKWYLYFHNFASIFWKWFLLLKAISNGAFNFVNCDLIFVNGAFIFVNGNWCLVFRNAAQFTSVKWWLYFINGAQFTFVNGACIFSYCAHFKFINGAFNFENEASIFWKWFLLLKAISSGALIFVIGVFIFINISSTFVMVRASIFKNDISISTNGTGSNMWCILFY